MVVARFGAVVFNADPAYGICSRWLLQVLRLWYLMLILMMGFVRDGCCEFWGWWWCMLILMMGFSRGGCCEVWGCRFNADPDDGICSRWLLLVLGLWYLMLILMMGFARGG